MSDDAKNEFDVRDDAEMQEIHDFDFGRAAMLMSIAEKVANVSPKSTSLLGIAQAELEHMNNQAKDIARRRADRAKEAEQRRYDAEQDRINREAAEAEKAAEADAHDGRPRAIPNKPTPEPVQQPGMPEPQRRR